MNLTGNNILLDTNAYSNLLRGDESILKLLKESSRIYFSIFVLAELNTGFKGGRKEKTNTQMLEKFLANKKVVLVNADKKTAHIFATIKHQLKKSGNPIPINDVWIAAHSIQYQAELITNDKHFKKVDGLTILS